MVSVAEQGSAEPPNRVPLRFAHSLDSTDEVQSCGGGSGARNEGAVVGTARIWKQRSRRERPLVAPAPLPLPQTG